MNFILFNVASKYCINKSINGRVALGLITSSKTRSSFKFRKKLRVGPIDNIYLGKIIYPKIKAKVHSNKGYFIIMFTYQWSRRKICSTRLSYSSESEPGTLISGQLFQLHRWACRWILGRFSNWCWIKKCSEPIRRRQSYRQPITWNSRIETLVSQKSGLW